ncbi:lysylphosphatidylglycerol synthase domain-containing protein [uncultured Eubacterium sp.]|uniref:lysylphosphatidylglycerol synthase domain-containing protein n=1 Tax=uncultured Eubacterium sp. TaxID=165185 RepID=UPI0026725F3C|nr:lysylphosphatidylglycerol synthase domain-containing protein [uncultured Eubacterium sp.]
MKSIKINKQSAMKICKAIFLILVAIFLAKYFIDNIDDIRSLDFKMDWKIFVLSMLFYFIYKITLASLWHYITYKNNASIKFKDAIICYLYSILGKYIPGKVFMLAARIPAYEKQGVKMRKVTVCFLLENVCTLLGAAFLFLLSLFFFPNDLLNKYQFMTIILIIVFFICINPKIINWGLRIVGKVMKKDDMEIPMNYLDMIKIVVMFIGNWLIVGIGFYMLVASIYPVPISQALYCGGIYGLAAIIGILAIFTPSGLGVREGIIAVGLALIMPNEYVVIVSIISRLWATIAELILIFFAFIINKIMVLREKKLSH